MKGLEKVALGFLFLGVSLIACWAAVRADRAVTDNQAIRGMVVSAGDRVSALAEDVEASQQIIDLPETSAAWHLSVFVGPTWQQNAREKEVVSWFSTEPRLIKLRDQVHDHLYTTDDPLYKTRYAAAVPKVPAVMLQDSAGKVRYKVGAANPIPASGRVMADQMQRLFDKFPHCPKPKPEPEPDKVKPDDTTIPVVVPDVVPDVVPVEFGFPKWAVLLVGGVLGAIGAALSIFYNIKQHA